MGAPCPNHVQQGPCVDQGTAGPGEHDSQPLHGKLATRAQRRLSACFGLGKLAVVPHGCSQGPYQDAPEGPERHGKSGNRFISHGS